MQKFASHTCLMSKRPRIRSSLLRSSGFAEAGHFRSCWRLNWSCFYPRIGLSLAVKAISKLDLAINSSKPLLHWRLLSPKLRISREQFWTALIPVGKYGVDASAPLSAAVILRSPIPQRMLVRVCLNRRACEQNRLAALEDAHQLQPRLSLPAGGAAVL